MRNHPSDFMRVSLAAALLPALVLGTGSAGAEPILGNDPALAAQAATYERQQDTFARVECAQNLDVNVRAADVDLVRDFFAQAEDFRTFSGKHPFEVMESQDEWGDMGNFSGIASVGLAARLMVLRRDGASAQEIAAARDTCVRAARTWHVFGAIAGPDSIARGVRRITPLAGEPALPGSPPDLVPLADANGALPANKGDTWRAPVAPGFDDWIWVDNTSKDQVSGYALAVLWLWDALRADPNAPQDVVDAMAADLGRFAKNLMKVAPELGVDLVVRDADGRLTSYGDLNSRLVSGTSGAALPEGSLLANGFNAMLAMGIMAAAYQVTRDETIGQFYYGELVGRRDYYKAAIETASLVYLGEKTNFSNVNMLAIALATLGRIEREPTARARLLDVIDKFWDSGNSRSAVHADQPWFDVLVAGFGRAEKPEIPERMRVALSGHGAAPTFQRERINCDADEIAARSCVAIDGATTLTLSAQTGRGGGPVSTTALPFSIRPDSNFLWRSDPFQVNDGGGNRLNPRGDWLAAYWLGRLLDRDPSKNVLAEGPPPKEILPPATAEDPAAADGPAGQGGAANDGGCGCKLHALALRRDAADARALGAFAALGALSVAGLGRRRRPRAARCPWRASQKR